MLVIIPQTTTSSAPAARRSASSEVPTNPFGAALESTGSAPAGVTLSWISTPGVPGRMNVASGASQTCLRWTTWSPAARKRCSNRAAFAAAASGPSSGFAPPGK